MLTTIARFNELPEAHILRGRLWAEGIPSFVTFQYHVGNNWFEAIALGGARVQVAAPDFDEAREIFELRRTDAFKSRLSEKFGTLDDPRCPACGSTRISKRRPLVQGTLGILIGFSVGGIPPLRRWIYTCADCGAPIPERDGSDDEKTDPYDFGMRFTEASTDDIAQMMNVRAEASENRLRSSAESEQANYEAVFRRGGMGWLCKIDDVVRAFALVDRDARCVHALFVDPNFKRNGIGRHLHNFAVDWLFALAATPIHLTTAPATGAERMFRKAGWRLVDVDGNDDYCFELEPDIWQSRRRKF